MRISNNMMTRNYLSGLNKAMNQYSKAQQQMTSGLRNDRISGNVRDEIFGLRVSAQMEAKEQFLTNIRDAQAELDVAESSLTSISDVLLTALGKIESGMSDDKAENGRETIATMLGSWQKQIVQFANTQYQEKQLMNGTVNNRAPFSLNADNELLYNGFRVDTIRVNNGKYVGVKDDDPAAGEQDLMEEEQIYIDLGTGIRIDGNNQVVDPASAFLLSVDGLKCLGFGQDTSTTPPTSKNVVNILGAVAKEFKKKTAANGYDADIVNNNFKALQDARQNLVVNISEIGTRGNFLETTGDRLEADLENLTKVQQKLLIVSDTEQATTVKQMDYLMNLNLAFGSKYLPLSLMDYLR